MDLKVHIKVLYRCCLLWGILQFVYDKRSERLVFSYRLHLISKILYSAIAVISGYIALICILKGILRLLCASQDFLSESFLAQDEIIEYLEYLTKYVSIYVNVITVLKRKRSIPRTVNKLFEVFDCLQHKTDNKLIIYPSIRYLFVIKLLFGVYRLVRFTGNGLYYLIKYNDLSSIFGEYLWQAASWSHMYAYLILICFYAKLDRYLSRYANRLNDKRLQEVIVITFQIHRVKRRIEVIFSPFLVLTYYALFNDVTNSFGIMKEILYKDYIVGHSDPALQRIYSLLGSFPDAISATFEIYMIGCISDALKEAEESLKNKIILFSTNENAYAFSEVRKNMELQLIHNKVHDLSIWAYRIFKIDKVFAFNHFLNIVVMYVIFCLQYFAKESVYSSSTANRRLIANYTKFVKKTEYL